MKAIVFGGTGFFGKELVDLLLNDGHDVTLVSRGSKAVRKHKNLENLISDRTQKESLLEVLGDRSWDVAFDQIGYCSNDAKILCEVLEGKIKHLVFTSSKSVYDYGTEIAEEVVDPNTYPLKFGDREDFDYAEGKRQAEACYIQNASFSVGIFRPPVVVGEKDTSGRWNWHIDRIKMGQEIYFPNLDAHFCVISSGDAGKALFFMGLNQIQGPLNFYSENPTLKEILALMEAAIGKKTILAKEKGSDNHSPYGIENDWYMSRQKAYDLGLTSEVDFATLAQKLSRLA